LKAAVYRAVVKFHPAGSVFNKNKHKKAVLTEVTFDNIGA
jgi:hypothetical protein